MTSSSFLNKLLSVAIKGSQVQLFIFNMPSVFLQNLFICGTFSLPVSLPLVICCTVCAFRPLQHIIYAYFPFTVTLYLFTLAS